MIIVVPTDSASIAPLVALTVATALFELLQTTTRPVSTAFAASRVTAVAVVKPPTTTEVAPSDTVTVATGTGDTVTVAEPPTPSLVAMIFAVPAATAITTPVPALTVATAVFELLHTITRPLSTLFAASRGTAVAVVLPPTTSEDAPSDAVTVATGTGVIVTVAEPVMPSLVAVMLAVPAATALTTPVPAFTVATAVFELLHTITRPVSTLFAASRATAVAVVAPPTWTEDAPSVVTMLATGTADTVTLAAPLIPSLVAIIDAVPTDTANTAPVVALTLATAEFELDHATARPVNTLFNASRSTALAVVVAPTTMDATLSDAVTDATGAGVTVTLVAPVLLSLVATMVAVPTATAVTTPDVALTVAIRSLLLLHVIERPVSTLFKASRSTALAWVVVPAAIDAVANDAVTVATLARPTVTDAAPVLVSLVALMIANPTPIPVTTPEFAFTVATRSFELLQTTARPVNTLFKASRVVAVACVV